MLQHSDQIELDGKSIILKTKNKQIQDKTCNKILLKLINENMDCYNTQKSNDQNILKNSNNFLEEDTCDYNSNDFDDNMQNFEFDFNDNEQNFESDFHSDNNETEEVTMEDIAKFHITNLKKQFPNFN